jgi:hypothetical protein
MLHNLTEPITAFAGETDKSSLEWSETVQSRRVVAITIYIPNGMNPLNYDVSVVELEDDFAETGIYDSASTNL